MLCRGNHGAWAHACGREEKGTMNLPVVRTWVQASLSRSEQGASLVEYILLVALIALAVIAAVVFFRGEMNSSFDNAGSKLSAVPYTTP